jgi:hypothetical protein
MHGVLDPSLIEIGRIGFPWHKMTVARGAALGYNGPYE